MDCHLVKDCEPLYGIALISSDSVYGQKVIFRYPVDFCGPKVMPLFFSKGDAKGWKRFAQLFNPFSKSNDIIISIGDSLSMIPRCIIKENVDKLNESSAFVIVLLLNSSVVNSQFFLENFVTFTTKLSLCLLKEEENSSYLQEEKALLLSIFNENKQSVRNGKMNEQYFMSLQLEGSQLARELAQIYHEVNYFHHTSILLHKSLPFHFSLPTKRLPHSCLEFYTSDIPVCEQNIELYYSILLLHEPSYYVQADKCPKNSFLDRFISIASPFLTIEEMSVLLDVPVEKVFAQALSLQAFNSISIIMCITKNSHLSIMPSLDFTQIQTKANQFETLFKGLGSLINLLAIFSNCPSLGDLFDQFHIPYSPFTNQKECCLLYNAITWLLQQRLILPVAIQCQYIASYQPLSPREESDKNDNESHHHSTSHSLHHITSSFQHHSESMNEMDNSSIDIHVSSKLKNSSYYPFSFLSVDSMNEHPESYSSYARVSPDHFEHYHMWKSKSGSCSSIHSVPTKSENKSSKHSALLEKCIPFMNQHYCVDEICYKLHISHSIFLEMVMENPRKFFTFYVAHY